MVGTPRGSGSTGGGVRLLKKGNLVRKTTRNGEVWHGIIVGWEACESWVEVAWIGSYPTWDAIRTVELVNEAA